jgi:hypothetical protein
MAYARVVSFEDVSSERMAELAKEISEGERPPELPASEMILLHDPDADRALALVFFETEDDYRRGDAFLDAMPSGDTPGRRASVSKYAVALRMTP